MITAADLHPFMISFSRIASRKRREREAEQNLRSRTSKLQRSKAKEQHIMNDS
jgi:hypothetical protein